jgi:hypothetical protein
MTFRQYLRKHRNPAELPKILLEIANGIEELH